MLTRRTIYEMAIKDIKEEWKAEDITKVLWKKLEWLRESLDANDLNNREHFETITVTQMILSILSEEKIKTIIKLYETV